MSLSEAVNSVLSKYFEFSGRARRSEYWWWVVAVALVEVVLSIVASVALASDLKGIGYSLYVVIFFFALAVVIPTLAVTWRRLHDTGRSGAWWFINFVPAIGGIVLLVFTVLDSQPGPNQYGAYPKAILNPNAGPPPVEA